MLALLLSVYQKRLNRPSQTRPSSSPPPLYGQFRCLRSSVTLPCFPGGGWVREFYRSSPFSAPRRSWALSGRPPFSALLFSHLTPQRSLRPITVRFSWSWESPSRFGVV